MAVGPARGQRPRPPARDPGIGGRARLQRQIGAAHIAERIGLADQPRELGQGSLSAFSGACESSPRSPSSSG